MRGANDEIGFVLVAVPDRLYLVEHLAANGAKAGLAVVDRAARHEPRRCTGKKVCDPPVLRHLLTSQIPRPDRNVTGVQRRNYGRSKRGVVLAVRVNRQHRSGVALQRGGKTGLKRGSLATIYGKLDGSVADGPEQRSGAVGGAVIYRSEERRVGK